MPLKTHILKYFLLFLLISHVSILADEVIIGVNKVVINLPKGFCPLKSRNQADARLINYLQDANKDINQVNLIFADCEQLQLWRKSKIATLNDYGYSLSPLSLINKELKMSNKNYLLQMEKVFNKKGTEFINKTSKDIEKIVQKHFATIKLNETKSLGVLSKDKHALYFGLIQKLKTEEGKDKIMIGIFAMTLVKKKSVNFYLWKEYKGERTIYDLESLASHWIFKVHTEN